jgi:hypothetical protein
MPKQSVMRQFRGASASVGIVERTLADKTLSTGSSTAYFIKLSVKTFSSLWYACLVKL